MSRVFVLSLGLLAATTMGGCSMSGLGSVGPVASAASVPEAPPPVVYGAFLEGPIGLKLSQADRDKALAAEQDALATGQRKTWKGDRGTFGFVEPAIVAPLAVSDPAVAPALDTCAAFTSTIFLNGRPQTGHGRGCRNGDGTFRIVG